MSPSLAEGYDTENGYIADKNGLIERAIELQETEYRNELRKITNLENLKTSMSGYIAEYKEAFSGGIVTNDMSAIGTTTATDFSNALYQAFNLNGSEKHNYDNTEKIARKIVGSLGINDVDSEIQKFINKNGVFESSWFFKEYADAIAKNIEIITNSLSADDVGLDDSTFEQKIETLDSAAQAYLDMKDAISIANEAIQQDLGYIAEYADGYSDLSTEQQKFVKDFLKNYNISDIMSESNNPFDQGWKLDDDKMASVKSQITKFVEELSQDKSTKEALANLYAIPTDEQSISEFVEQFRSALKIIKTYCEENGIEIPIAITNSEKEVNELEEQYQHAVDYAKDKFNGYDPTTFFKENSINTQEEVDKWLEIAQDANTASDAEERYIQSSIVSFTDAFNSPEFAESAHALEELAKSGEITPEVLTSTEAYAELLKQTGLSADEATNKILDLLSSQEKLAGASNGLKQLQSSYEEFNELGFVTAATLESLPEVFKNLDGFDLFSKIVGDPTQGQEKIQQAFDDIVKQYLISQDTLSSLSNSSESEIQSYIANLKQMGITNAEEVVTQAMNVLSQDNQLLDEAETEYMMYLEHKDSADTEYLESLTIKNSELVSALGKPYESDYNNWCELLTKKSEAYNEFVTRIGGSYNPELSAAENLQANGKEVNTFSLQEYYTYKAAYDQAVTDAQKMKDTLKLDLSTIDTNFNTNFSAGSSGSSTDSSTASDAKEEATETFDFIQNGLDLWERNMNRIKQVAENTYLSLTKRAKAYKDEIDGTAFGIQLLQKDYETYMAKANAVGLDENLAAAVRGGSSDITDITDDNVKQQIQDYESWYDKAQDCLDQIEELKIQLTELKLQKIQLEIDVKADKLTRLESALDKIQGKIDLKETWGFQASVKNYTKMNANLSNAAIAGQKAAFIIDYRNSSTRQPFLAVA